MSPSPFATEYVARADTPFARDVLAGLSRRRKSVSSTWLYDHHGSQLFEDITLLPEYYLTRTEIALLERHAADIGTLAGARCTVVEFGSGSSRKTPLLLSGLYKPGLYVPVDISAQFLVESVSALKAVYPRLPVQPFIGDLRTLQQLALPPAEHGRRLGFFPGSTLGNFAPEEAVSLLMRFGRILGPGALLVLGVDGTQDEAVLQAAYDDPLGVTAAFNRNLLSRINRELGGGFDLERFEHEARWDSEERCIEMHLVSQVAQTVTVLGEDFFFDAGESLHTESSYKLGPLQLQALAAHGCWRLLRSFADDDSRYTLALLERAP